MTNKSKDVTPWKISYEKYINRIKGKYDSGKYVPSLKTIRFFSYKNILDNSIIEFNFPITLLVGENGTNKTSILRAIEACPGDKSLGDYWFDTDLDIIPKANRPRYIYQYDIPNSSRTAEVKKMRILNSNRGADYFETTKPHRRDGMSPMPKLSELKKSEKIYANKTRWKPLSKPVLYIDFRQEVPAYDINMFFGVSAKDISGIKTRIRNTSHRIKKIFDGCTGEEYEVWHKKNRVIEPLIDLSNEEISWISYILGKKYSNIKIIKHSFFDVSGYTVLIDSNSIYSEAYAGSGEYAVIMMVHKMWTANDSSLIIMDEPETSLHPGAQSKLLKYILFICYQRNTQFVISTHSPYISERLPNECRVRLEIAPDNDDKVVPYSNSPHKLTFAALGGILHEDLSKSNLIVEDKLAEHLIKRAIHIHGDSKTLDLININILPGGVSTLYEKVIPIFSTLNANTLRIVLDGDQRKNIEDPYKISAEGSQDSHIAFDEIRKQRKDKLLNKLGNNSKALLLNSNDSGTIREDEVIEQLLQWIDSHVGYLPGTKNPEHLILSCLADNNLLDDDINIEMMNNDDAKDFFKQKAEKSSFSSEVSAADIFQEQKTYANKIPEDCSIWKEIYEEVSQILSTND